MKTFRTHIIQRVHVDEDEVSHPDAPQHYLTELPFVLVPGLGFITPKGINVNIEHTTWDERRQTFVCRVRPLWIERNQQAITFEKLRLQGWRELEPA